MEDSWSLSLEDLQEEYKRLFKYNQQLLLSKEEDAQRIHDLQRNLSTSNANAAYLTQELDQLITTTTTTANNNDNYTKLQKEFEDVKSKYNQLLPEHTTLQQEYEILLADNLKITKETNILIQQKKIENKEDPIVKQITVRVNALELENDELLRKIEELRNDVINYTMQIAERDKNIEILSEQLKCAEENFRFKRDELEEKLQLLESTQEQLYEANSKIAMLSAAPENNDRKGNSLFAEVDDQRQAMKQLLVTQKKKYISMKQIYEESQYEIRRLKRENIAMHTELQTCSSIFCSADKIYNEKRNEYIQHLLNQYEEIENKLNWTQNRLRELAVKNGVDWIDSMLNYCKQETNNYKQQLHSVRIQKAGVDQELRNIQQEMARWRFEALRSRCVLMDRENLLKEHQIDFKPKNSINVNLSENDIKKCTPQIQNNNDVQITNNDNNDDKNIHKLKNEIDDKNINKSKNEIVLKDKKTAEVNIKANESEKDTQTKLKLNENVTIFSNQQNADIKTKQTANFHIENQENELMPLNVVNECFKDISLHEKNTNDDVSIKCNKQINTHKECLPGPSILCKKRNVFQDQTHKNVQFSSKPTEIHNISINDDSHVKNNEKNTKSETTTVKEIRTKSNIIIRRFVGTNKNA